MATSKATATIEIKPLKLERVTFVIQGDTPLIVHRWSEKAKKQMLDKQQGKTISKKEAKDPERDYEDSMYRFDDGAHGFPAAAFKSACVGACRLFDGLPMTHAKIAIRVDGELNASGEQLVHIDGEPRMREDMVRLESGVADIRYRAEYPVWRAHVPVTFNAGMLSLEQLVNLLDGAGFGGVGEWRPSAPKSFTGSFGTFHVIGTE